MNTNDNLLPPHSIDDENAMIGSMMIDPDSVMLVRDLVRPQDFYTQTNAQICEAIYQLDDANKPLDILTISGQMSKNGHETNPADLIDFTNMVPTSINIRFYAERVTEMSQRRQMIKAAGEMAKLGYDLTGDVSQQMDAAETNIMAIRERQASKNMGYPRIYMQEYLDEIERLSMLDNPLAGCPTSIKELDELISGWESSQMHILAARPKMGKSALMMQAARYNASIGKSVAYFSLEMTRHQLTIRNVAALTGIPTQRLRVGKLYDVEQAVHFETVGKMSEWRLFIDDTRAISPAQVSAKCRRLANDRGLDVVFIDYIGLMTPPNNYNGNRNIEVAEISAALTQLAGDMSVPVIVASQLNRSVEQRGDKRPLLSDLRDSGSLEQDAYTVTFIYRDEYYNPDTSDEPGIAELIVAANRGGAGATVKTGWDGPTTTFGFYERPMSPAVRRIQL